MRRGAHLRIGATAALAIGAALALYAPAAAQDGLGYERILEVVTGAWELDPAEVAEEDRGEHRCGQSPEVIRIVEEDGALRYESQSGYAPDAAINRSALRAIPNALVLQYEDEQRLTPAGEPVEWLLFMPDEDHFYWVRVDWLQSQPGGRTSMRRRCPEAPIA
jgi:hypothetical protein